jgi:hypothetical protein
MSLAPGLWLGGTLSPKAHGGGLPPAGLWPRPRRNPPRAHKEEGVGCLLVVRLWEEADAGAFVWRMPGVEARVPCPQEEGRKDHGKEKEARAAQAGAWGPAQGGGSF